MGLPMKSLREVRAEIAKIKERIGLRKKEMEDDEHRLKIFEKLEKQLSSHPPPVLAVTPVPELEEGPSTGLLLPAVSTPTSTSSSSSDGGIEITYTPTPSPPSDQDDMDYEPHGEEYVVAE